eukprot:4459042-Amphidinium_carterae.1
MAAKLEKVALTATTFERCALDVASTTEVPLLAAWMDQGCLPQVSHAATHSACFRTGTISSTGQNDMTNNLVKSGSYGCYLESIVHLNIAYRPSNNAHFFNEMMNFTPTTILTNYMPAEVRPTAD